MRYGGFRPSAVVITAPTPPIPTNTHSHPTDESLAPTDALEATLRLSRAETAAAGAPTAPLDRLLLSPQDMRRLGLRAGDWVGITAAAAPPPQSAEGCVADSTPQGGGGVAVMRAWPAVGVALPAGTVGPLRIDLFGSCALATTMVDRPSLPIQSIPRTDNPGPRRAPSALRAVPRAQLQRCPARHPPFLPPPPDCHPPSDPRPATARRSRTRHHRRQGLDRAAAAVLGGAAEGRAAGAGRVPRAGVGV